MWNYFKVNLILGFLMNIAIYSALKLLFAQMPPPFTLIQPLHLSF